MSKMRVLVSGLLVAVVALILVVPCSAASDRVLLRINLHAGDIYEQRVTVDQTFTQSLYGQEMDIVQKMTYVLSYSVERVNPDGSLVLTAMYKHVYCKLESPLTAFEFDSANPGGAAPMIAGILRGLVGKKLTLIMTASGQVIEIVGAEETLSAMLSGIDPGQRAQMEASMKDQFSKESLEENFGGLAAYPDYPVAVGESWTTKQTRVGSAPLKVIATYTLRERNTGVSFIDVSSAVTSSPEPVVSGAAKIVYGLSGTQQGTMEVNEQTGLATHAQVEQRVEGDMKIESNGSVIIVPITIKSSIEYETP